MCACNGSFFSSSFSLLPDHVPGPFFHFNASPTVLVHSFASSTFNPRMSMVRMMDISALEVPHGTAAKRVLSLVFFFHVSRSLPEFKPCCDVSTTKATPGASPHLGANKAVVQPRPCFWPPLAITMKTLAKQSDSLPYSLRCLPQSASPPPTTLS